MPGLSSWAVRRPVFALSAWFVAVIAIFGVGSTFAGTLNDSFDLPNTESKTATDLLASSGANTGSYEAGATIVWSPTCRKPGSGATAASNLRSSVLPA